MAKSFRTNAFEHSPSSSHPWCSHACLRRGTTSRCKRNAQTISMFCKLSTIEAGQHPHSTSVRVSPELTFLTHPGHSNELAATPSLMPIFTGQTPFVHGSALIGMGIRLRVLTRLPPVSEFLGIGYLLDIFYSQCWMKKKEKTVEYYKLCFSR